MNLYEVLQVSPEANTEVIRAAYRTLARSHHPDVNPDPEATRHMRRLNAAYEILCDPGRRARYDAARARLASVRSTRAARSASHGGVGSVRASGGLAARRPPRTPVRTAEAALVVAAVPASPVRLGMLLLLVVAVTAAILVSLWGLSVLLDDRSPYEIHLDVGAQPTLNRA